MIKHIVMWRLKEGPEKEKNVQVMKRELEALRGKIDGLLQLEVGLNFEGSEAASDVVLVTQFNTMQDLERYQSHPLHVAAGANYVRPVVCERRVVDYEI